MTEYYAHSLEGKPPSEWQRLDEHLENVAVMPRLFAEKFGAGDWAYMVGLKKIYAHSLEANLRRNGRG
jgi:CRISPR-associated endonuclease/helicase Cas3